MSFPLYVAFPRSESYDRSDFQINVLRSLIFGLVSQYSVLLRAIWISHVHPCTFIACHARRPRASHLALSAASTMGFRSAPTLAIFPRSVRPEERATRASRRARSKIKNIKTIFYFVELSRKAYHRHLRLGLPSFFCSILRFFFRILLGVHQLK